MNCLDDLLFGERFVNAVVLLLGDSIWDMFQEYVFIISINVTIFCVQFGKMKVSSIFNIRIATHNYSFISSDFCDVIGRLSDCKLFMKVICVFISTFQPCGSRFQTLAVFFCSKSLMHFNLLGDFILEC